MDEREDKLPDIPIWHREDPYLDENGELPVEEQHHRAKVDAAIETLKFAFPALIIPVGLVMFGLSLFVGAGVWKLIILLPFLYYFAIVATPLVARLRKGGELRLPGHAPLTGAQKRNALIASLIAASCITAYATYGGIWQRQALEWLRTTLLG